MHIHTHIYTPGWDVGVRKTDAGLCQVLGAGSEMHLQVP